MKILTWEEAKNEGANEALDRVLKFVELAERATSSSKVQRVNIGIIKNLLETIKKQYK